VAPTDRHAPRDARRGRCVDGLQARHLSGVGVNRRSQRNSLEAAAPGARRSHPVRSRRGGSGLVWSIVLRERRLPYIARHALARKRDLGGRLILGMEQILIAGRAGSRLHPGWLAASSRRGSLGRRRWRVRGGCCGARRRPTEYGEASPRGPAGALWPHDRAADLRGAGEGVAGCAEPRAQVSDALRSIVQPRVLALPDFQARIRSMSSTLDHSASGEWR